MHITGLDNVPVIEGNASDDDIDDDDDDDDDDIFNFSFTKKSRLCRPEDIFDEALEM
ncbi:hypothetical protein G9A89_019146 [Geosiphon pyriformis]|nr:hypothetical protein G9A89_019146 [Geosiphon pyriformis]